MGQKITIYKVKEKNLSKIFALKMSSFYLIRAYKNAIPIKINIIFDIIQVKIFTK